MNMREGMGGREGGRDGGREGGREGRTDGGEGGKEGGRVRVLPLVMIDYHLPTIFVR